MNSIWKQLKQAQRPFFILAPMDDVTDTVFREIVVHAAAPDLLFTEFASTDGFVHPKGAISVERKLQVNKTERDLSVPLIAQIWGSNPEHYRQTAETLSKRGGFAGIDINMGCPEKGIVKRGCCGGLIKEENWDNAAAIIQATKEGAGDLPVSVKTRIGVNRIATEEWTSHLLKQDIAALTIHGRTVKEMSKVPAHWDEIAKVAHLRDQLAPETVIIGNGDVTSHGQGETLAQEHGLDGIMIGRGIFKNLFVFDETQTEHSQEEMFGILLQHVDLYEQTWGDAKSFEPLKKFFKVYCNGFPGAADIRTQLMETHSAEEARKLVQSLQLQVS